MHEKQQKNAEKFFKITAKPSGKSVLPHYIWGILLKVHAELIPPVTVSQIQKLLQRQHKAYYHRDTIQLALNNIRMYIPEVELVCKEMHVPDCPRAKPLTFSIKFINPIHKTAEQ
jgi:hypothetical protein